MNKHQSRKSVPYRREREGKTDYRRRMKLLRSGKPRFVTRISLKHVRCQIAVSGPDGDEVQTSAFSKELRDWGWKGNTSNTPAAYLVGFLCGYRGINDGIEEGVLDIDRFEPSPQAKVFAILKGVTDSGVYIPH
ncbi:MAG: 50S ribosomal protein L18, partial [Candidatus Aenigmatarchaeota archaeon]